MKQQTARVPPNRWTGDIAAAGDPAFVRIVHKGHLRRPMRDLRLLDDERHILEYALR